MTCIISFFFYCKLISIFHIYPPSITSKMQIYPPSITSKMQPCKPCFFFTLSNYMQYVFCHMILYWWICINNWHCLPITQICVITENDWNDRLSPTNKSQFPHLLQPHDGQSINKNSLIRTDYLIEQHIITQLCTIGLEKAKQRPVHIEVLHTDHVCTNTFKTPHTIYKCQMHYVY